MKTTRICSLVSVHVVAVATVFAIQGMVDPVAAQVEIGLPSGKTIANLIELLNPSIVQIETIGGSPTVAGLRVADHATTGTIVGPNGHVVTAAFNLAHQPDSIFIRLHDGRRLPAKRIATNHSRQVVLLKVEQTGLAPVDFVTRESLSVGQTAVALGRSRNPSQPDPSVGIVSAVQRIWGRAIQTDAAVSPINYGGPLVDIRGNVIGILVPMSPRGTDVVQGADWYDSGIGFAVPLDELRLERLTAGENLYPGLSGITISEKQGYASPCIVQACPANSPAGLAGILPDDLLVSINSRQLVRASDFQHAVGPLYAGDTVQVQFLRGGEKVNAEFRLVRSIDPWVHSMMGFLARVDSGKVVVDQVLQGGPADKAGLRGGDLITTISGQPDFIDSLSGIRQVITRTPVGQMIQLGIDRDGKPVSLPIETTRLDAGQWTTKAIADKRNDKTGDTTEVRIPEFPNRCYAYFPGHASPSSLLLWISEPGAFDSEKEIEKWKPFCDRFNVSLLLPVSTQLDRWNPDEIEFLNQLAIRMRQQGLDSGRFVVAGQLSGAVMASRLATAYPASWNGVAMVNSAASKRALRVPSDPTRRQLLLFIDDGHDPKRSTAIVQSQQAMIRQGFAAHLENLKGDFRQTIVSWIASVARF